ncbi:hypothetical protein M409DRAFT_49431 [Zasmidium cellare ATCC 36951]|uniref:Uncharacterized protein n=1 Tax=Zasmidium cellare ATCC 36951 TaxID=1080233 RepID=A0A6A6D0N0_ZASCE|nr:uncharacterized protein M409DRAFT_49431 [Zasmidium cellare ATCC 36951]KAF2172921.1 hypothetical protein M409DRAFT_49431 [Zasmidium cellare ATCC 36951]
MPRRWGGPGNATPSRFASSLSASARPDALGADSTTDAPENDSTRRAVGKPALAGGLLTGKGTAQQASSHASPRRQRSGRETVSDRQQGVAPWRLCTMSCSLTVACIVYRRAGTAGDRFAFSC